ncbi:DUF2179 domain-containing protein [Balneolaceae bacterium ANBcel3]|nr:DUF2179 domain-containing protein [Balneolaceae bacterium ANBcel3]
MELLTFEFDWLGWVILPILIFFARVIDVTLGTLRIIFVARSMKVLAPLVGFFESLIWLLAVGQIVQSLTNVGLYIAFAAGFSFGNYIGIYLEEKIAMGLLCVRTITNEDATELIEYLKEHDFGVTSVSASGISGQVRLILSIIKRKDLEMMIRIIKEKAPRAFVSVEDVRSVNEGYFSPRKTGFLRMPQVRK